MQPESPSGAVVLPGARLASFWPAAALDDDVLDTVRSAPIREPGRTTEHDIELSLQSLADIAVKALSPGINDPPTATICIDRVREVVVTLANRTPPDEVRSGGDGSVRLVVSGPSFAHLVEVAFSQIRHYGAGDPAVAAHLIEALGRLAALVPSDRRPPILGQAGDCLRTAREQLTLPGDQHRLDAAAAWMTSISPDTMPPAPGRR